MFRSIASVASDTTTRSWQIKPRGQYSTRCVREIAPATNVCSSLKRWLDDTRPGDLHRDNTGRVLDVPLRCRRGARLLVRTWCRFHHVALGDVHKSDDDAVDLFVHGAIRPDAHVVPAAAAATHFGANRSGIREHRPRILHEVIVLQLVRKIGDRAAFV